MHWRVPQTLGSQNTEQLPTINGKPVVKYFRKGPGIFFGGGRGFLTGFLTLFSYVVVSYGSPPQVLSPPRPHPLLPLFSLSSRWEENKQFISLDIHAFGVSPSILSSLSRYFLWSQLLRKCINHFVTSIHMKFPLAFLSPHIGLFAQRMMTITRRIRKVKLLFILSPQKWIFFFFYFYPQDLILMQTLFWLRQKAVHSPPDPNLSNNSLHAYRRRPLRAETMFVSILYPQNPA